jgi:hypothetical protein
MKRFSAKTAGVPFEVRTGTCRIQARSCSQCVEMSHKEYPSGEMGAGITSGIQQNLHGERWRLAEQADLVTCIREWILVRTEARTSIILTDECFCGFPQALRKICNSIYELGFLPHVL